MNRFSKFLTGCICCAVLSACDTQKPQDDTTARENKQSALIQDRLARAVPTPELKTSAERQALVKRAQTWDDLDKISYIYLVDEGRIMAYYVVKGKVASLQSTLNAEEQIIQRSIGDHKEGFVLPSPDVDGTYGANTIGVFFFTPEGAYVEWNGKYVLSDQPLKVNQEPLLIRTVK